MSLTHWFQVEAKIFTSTQKKKKNSHLITKLCDQSARKWMNELVRTVSIYPSGVLNSIHFVDTACAAASSAQAKGTRRRRRSDRASSSARLESKGKKRRKTVVGLSMVMSALCSVASVVRIVPLSTVASSISKSSSVKLPQLVAQRQQQQQQVSAAGKCMAASSSVEVTIE